MGEWLHNRMLLLRVWSCSPEASQSLLCDAGAQRMAVHWQKALRASSPLSGLAQQFLGRWQHGLRCALCLGCIFLAKHIWSGVGQPSLNIAGRFEYIWVIGFSMSHELVTSLSPECGHSHWFYLHFQARVDQFPCFLKRRNIHKRNAILFFPRTTEKAVFGD